MSCNISSGRSLPCKDSQGGIKAVYLADFGTLGDATLGSSDEITAFSGSGNVFKYELKGANALTQTLNISRENGTTFVAQELTLTLPKLSKEDHKEFKLLTHGMVQAVVEDYNGVYHIVGLEHGADVSAGTAVTGTAMGDLSGYTFTLTANEPHFAPVYEDAVSFLDGFNVA